MKRWPFVIGFILFVFVVEVRRFKFGAEVLSDSISAMFFVAEVLCGIVAIAIKGKQ